MRVVYGDVFDVAVDLRRRSPTFGRWTGAILSADNKRQLWIPPGFAHGFYALSETADLTYKVTDYYAPEWDRTLTWVQFRAQYYLIGLIFLIFDVETIFLLPFAVALGGLTAGAFVAMMVFLLLLGEGLIWAWQKGVLTWK